MERKGRKSAYVKVNLNDSIYILIQRLAKERNMSVSAMLQQIIVADLYRGGHISPNMLKTLAKIQREHINIA